MTVQDLLTSDASSRTPLSWGAYIIQEWSPGDHISLVRNPEYFRQAEGLPYLDRLVIRFIRQPADAIAALLAGECDYLEESYALDSQLQEIEELQTAGKLSLLEFPSSAWEHIVFGINSLDTDAPPFFMAREARQAVAFCSDRQKITDLLFQGQSQIPDSYVSPDHPLVNPDVRHYSFDPAAAVKLLEAMGWIDSDNTPETARVAQGVNGVADGTRFEVELLTADSPQNQLIGELLRDSLAQCGITLSIKQLPADQLFGAGQNSLIFGRNFSLAQFGWMGSWQPACFLYITQEIPGSFPEHPKGWGGSNPTGYSHPDFDRACQRALTTLPEEQSYASAHYLAQAIFAEDLPALPLFLHTRRVVTRPDLCAPPLDPSVDSTLWNLESFDYGEGCIQ